MITKTVVETTIKTYGKNAKDTGSSEVQVALLTENIKSLTQHFKTHPKDLHSIRGLKQMIAKRKKLLKYIKIRNSDEYTKLIKTLKIRG